ncbi:MAG: glycosyltransferase family 4 protein, partial [Candidatus Kariarchaeaceae archaeon]
ESIYRHECALEAFQLISREHPDAVLTIIGTGSRENELKTLTKSLGLQNVHFVGTVNHSEMQNLYDEADVFLNPTCPDNVSVAVLESFACGLPVISANSEGIKELIEDRVNGLFFSAGNAREMYERMAEIIENAALGKTLTSNGRRTWESYSCESVRPIYEWIYKKPTQ